MTMLVEGGERGKKKERKKKKAKESILLKCTGKPGFSLHIQKITKCSADIGTQPY